VLYQGSAPATLAPVSPSFKNVVQAPAALPDESRDRERGREWIEDKVKEQFEESRLKDKMKRCFKYRETQRIGRAARPG
jgi:hypothetical protein